MRKRYKYGPTEARRRGANITEAQCKAHPDLEGWDVTKRGWPDFVAFSPDGSVRVIEVKPRKPDGSLKALKVEQIRILNWLYSLGVDVYLSDGDQLEPYEPR